MTIPKLACKHWYVVIRSPDINALQEIKFKHKELQNLHPRSRVGIPVSGIVPMELLASCKNHPVVMQSLLEFLAWAKAIIFGEPEIASHLEAMSHQMSWDEIFELERQIRNFDDEVWQALILKLCTWFITKQVHNTPHMKSILVKTAAPIICMDENCPLGAGTNNVLIACSDSRPGKNIVGLACEIVRAECIARNNAPQVE